MAMSGIQYPKQIIRFRVPERWCDLFIIEPQFYVNHWEKVRSGLQTRAGPFKGNHSNFKKKKSDAVRRPAKVVIKKLAVITSLTRKSPD